MDEFDEFDEHTNDEDLPEEESNEPEEENSTLEIPEGTLGAFAPQEENEEERFIEYIQDIIFNPLLSSSEEMEKIYALKAEKHGFKESIRGGVLMGMKDLQNEELVEYQTLLAKHPEHLSAEENDQWAMLYLKRMGIDEPEAEHAVFAKLLHRSKHGKLQSHERFQMENLACKFWGYKLEKQPVKAVV